MATAISSDGSAWRMRAMRSASSSAGQYCATARAITALSCEQRQHDGPRRGGGVQQAIGQRGAHLDRGVVEKADERGIERRLFVGRAGMGQIGERGEMGRLPPGLAIAGLRQLDELVIRNHLALRRR